MTNEDIQAQITSREKEAIKEVLNHYMDDEEQDCREWLHNKYGKELLDTDDSDKDRNNHIYSSLQILEQLLNRINTEK